MLTRFLFQTSYPTPSPGPAELPPLTDPNYINRLIEAGINFLPRLIVSLLIFLAGLYLARLFSNILRRGLEARQRKAQLILLLTRITYWTVVVMVTTIALQNIGFNLTAFLAGLGILGFTVGFALQDVSKNFISGLLMLLSQPFEIGDAIEVAGYLGVVQAIELRATELKTLDGKQVLIPNAEVFANPLTNFSRYQHRRLEVKVGVAYGTDLEKARQVALTAIQSLKGVLADPAPLLVFDGLGDWAINFTLYYWIDQSEASYPDLVDAGVVTLSRALQEAGIEIPFPVQNVHLLDQPA